MYPSMQNCQWQPIKYCLIYVFCESPFEMVNFSDEVNAEIQIYPPMQNCQWQQIKYCLIYVFSESPFKTVNFSDEVNAEI